MQTSERNKELRSCMLVVYIHITAALYYIITVSLTLSMAATRSGSYVNVTVNIIWRLLQSVRVGSSVGIATNHWLDGLESNPFWGRDFAPVQNGSGSHPASCKWVPAFLGLNSARACK